MKTNMLIDMKYGTRRKRRNAVKDILTALIAIRDAEQNCLDNVPENLQCTESFEVGEYAIETLVEIIELLGYVY